MVTVSGVRGRVRMSLVRWQTRSMQGLGVMNDTSVSEAVRMQREKVRCVSVIRPDGAFIDIYVDYV